jgi:hypothetical protein
MLITNFSFHKNSKEKSHYFCPNFQSTSPQTKQFLSRSLSAAKLLDVLNAHSRKNDNVAHEMNV